MQNFHSILINSNPIKLGLFLLDTFTAASSYTPCQNISRSWRCQKSKTFPSALFSVSRFDPQFEDNPTGPGQWMCRWIGRVYASGKWDHWRKSDGMMNGHDGILMEIWPGWFMINTHGRKSEYQSSVLVGGRWGGVLRQRGNTKKINVLHILRAGTEGRLAVTVLPVDDEYCFPDWRRIRCNVGQALCAGNLVGKPMRIKNTLPHRKLTAVIFIYRLIYLIGVQALVKNVSLLFGGGQLCGGGERVEQEAISTSC